MTYLPVSSSAVKRIGYDPDTRTLGVIWPDDSVTHYLAVPRRAHTQLIMADSIGRHINVHIKPVYKGIAVDAEASE